MGFLWAGLPLYFILYFRVGRVIFTMCLHILGIALNDARAAQEGVHQVLMHYESCVVLHDNAAPCVASPHPCTPRISNVSAAPSGSGGGGSEHHDDRRPDKRRA